MHVKIVKIETSKSMILKFIKYPKIQIKTISKKLSENLRINLNFYESQKHGTHTKKKNKKTKAAIINLYSAAISFALLRILH